MEVEGLPRRIQTILQTFIEYPDTRTHLLLVGPPGSGKTTSARYFVNEIHKRSQFGKALFLNSSDERGLEAVRSRVYPFLRSGISTLFGEDTVGPKLIVFDEAETLTDQAQIALRPILDTSPQKVIILFLCNSISRIHPSIIHKFLCIPFEAPKQNEFLMRIRKIVSTTAATAALTVGAASVPTTPSAITPMDIYFRRGDIRFFLLNPSKHSECAAVFRTLFHTHATHLEEAVQHILHRWNSLEFLMFCFYLLSLYGLATVEATTHLLRISDTDLIRICPPKKQARLFTHWIQTYLLGHLMNVAQSTPSVDTKNWRWCDVEDGQ